VTPQRAFDAHFIADEIEESAPCFVKVVIADTGRDLERRAGNAAMIGDMQVGAKVRTTEVDDAARMPGQRLGALGNGLELSRIAMAGVHR
jgi:hypothetical protein